MVLAVITSQDIVYFGSLVFLVFMGLAASTFFAWWMGRESSSPSPYSGHRLRRGSELHWLAVEKVLRYLFEMHDYNNRMFDLQKSAVCRETGRIFPEALTWYGALRVDWSFIQNRYPGRFVSWGSLTEDQKLVIIDKHESLEGFQIEFSSPIPSPRKIDPIYANAKPGPLYVDVETGFLLGWKCVPETEFEVLIVQKPKEIYMPGLTKK